MEDLYSFPAAALNEINKQNLDKKKKKGKNRPVFYFTAMSIPMKFV